MAATNWFRKNQRKLLGILVVFLMVIWGIGPGIDYFVPKPPVGEILGEKISQEEFNDTLIRWARIFFKGSKEPVAEQVWEQLALVHKARGMGISVTNEELNQEIQSWLSIGQQTFTNREEYRRMLGLIFHMTEYQFEKTIREYLLAKKLLFLLRNSVKITREEALQRYVKENEKAKVKYAAFRAKDYVDQVETDEDEIKSFYDKYSKVFPNEEDGTWGYKEQEKVKLEYVMARYDVIEKQINIDGKELQEYYENKKDIIFKKESEYNLKEGEKSEDGKEDKTSTPEYKPFEEVKEQIVFTLKRKKSEELANKLIGDADNDVYENIDKEKFIDFSKIAAKFGLSYIVPTNSTDGTNYFTKDELRKEIIGLEQFPQLVFDREINDPSPPISSLEGKLIFRVLEKLEPTIPSYSEIHDKVAEDFRYEKAFRRAETLAKECLEKINQTSFDEGIKSVEGETDKINIIETDYFNRPVIFNEDGNYIKVLGSDMPTLASTAFDLKIGETAIAVEGRGEKICYVVKLIDRKKADAEKFEEEKESATEKYLLEKRSIFLSEWESWVHEKTQLGNRRS